MMKWEVERHIPFSANDIEMSYQAIDPEAAADPNNPTMEVLLAVARRDMIGLHLNTLEAAGLTPVAIDIEPLAVGRALIDLDKRGLANKNVVVVNVGAAITDVGVYKSGVLRFPRTIPIAGENFTRAIADQLGITLEAAEEEKKQDALILMELLGSGAGHAFDAPAAESSPFDFDFDNAAPPPAADFSLPGSEQTPPAADDPFASAAAFDPYGNQPASGPSESGTPPPAPAPAPVPATTADPNDPRYRRRREIFDALLPVLGEFSMEIRRSVDYFRSRYPSDTVDQILLCGGSARIGNLDQYIQYEMGIPTAVADPFANVTNSSKQMSGQRLTDVAPAFAVALGLAARDAVLGAG
jgi:type IV pilus assembly protein PilM